MLDQMREPRQGENSSYPHENKNNGEQNGEKEAEKSDTTTDQEYQRAILSLFLKQNNKDVSGYENTLFAKEYQDEPIIVNTSAGKFLSILLV